MPGLARQTGHEPPAGIGHIREDCGGHAQFAAEQKWQQSADLGRPVDHVHEQCARPLVLDPCRFVADRAEKLVGPADISRGARRQDLEAQA